MYIFVCYVIFGVNVRAFCRKYMIENNTVNHGQGFPNWKLIYIVCIIYLLNNPFLCSAPGIIIFFEVYLFCDFFNNMDSDRICERSCG